MAEGSGKNEKTKYRLAQAVKECMKTTPVDKITVKEIVEACQVTRQTFYRNFQDKYDLINWYFDKLLQESFAHMGEGKTVYEGLVKKFEYIKQERVFFAGAFRSDDYNSLKGHDFQLILEFYTERIREKTGKDPEEKIRFLLEMYCQGSIYMTVKWVLGGMKETPEEMAKLLVDAMPEAIFGLFQQLGLV
ncbi:MAG: TetR/AcrR family transcriptional regulator C-terminal domain-containing protein [Lachnospiraceae bacterium]|jgi:probable dihydroxyacetone kinase regulator